MIGRKLKRLKPWVVFPTQWIQDHGLKEFRWRQEQGSDHAAGLMVLIVLAHHAAYETGGFAAPPGGSTG